MSGIQISGLGILFSIGGGWNYGDNKEAEVDLSLNKWYNFTATFNGGRMDLWLNGTRVRSYTTDGSIHYYGDDFYLGGFWGSNSRNLYGKLTSCGVWDRALSSDEILELYNDGLGLVYS